MKKTRLSWAGRFFLAALIAFIAVAVFVIAGSRIRFRNVEESISLGGKIWGVNIDGTKNEIFLIEEINGDAGIGQFLPLDQIRHGRIVTFPDYVVSDEGEMFLQVKEALPDGAEKRSVARWDTKKNRLMPIWEMPETVSRVTLEMEINGETISLWMVRHPEEGEPCFETFRITTDGEQLSAEQEAETGREAEESTGKPEGFPVEVLVRSPGTTAGRILRCFGAVLLILAAGFAMIYPLNRKGIRLNLAFRICLLTALMLLCLTCLCGIFLEGYLYDYVRGSELRNCAARAEIFGRTADETLLEAMIMGSAPRTRENCIKAWNSAKDGGSAAVCEEEGVLYMLGDFYNREAWFTPVDEGNLRTRITGAFRNETERRFFYSGRRGQYACAFYPMTLSSGREILMGVQTPMDRVLLDFRQFRNRIFRIIVLIGLGIFFVSMIVIFHCLFPLKSLRTAVSKVASGDFSARAYDRGHTEVSHTARSFNRMAEQFEKQSAGADSYRRFYEAFLPAKLYREFSRKKIAGLLSAGESCRGYSITLVMNWSSEAGEILKLQDVAAEVIAANEGCIAVVTETGLKAAFPGGTEDALRAAAHIRQKARPDIWDSIHMGIAGGITELFSAGSLQRRSVLVNDSGEADALAEIAGRFGSAAVLTEDIYQGMQTKMKGYHFRFLGRIALEQSTAPEGSALVSAVPESAAPLLYISLAPLYELLEAENAERRQKKEMTREIFEAGAHAYAAGDFFAARNAMIRVLAEDPKDRAARSYVFSCDRKEPPKVCQAEK